VLYDLWLTEVPADISCLVSCSASSYESTVGYRLLYSVISGGGGLPARPRACPGINESCHRTEFAVAESALSVLRLRERDGEQCCYFTVDTDVL